MAEKGRDSIDFGRDGIWALFRAYGWQYRRPKR